MAQQNRFPEAIIAAISTSTTLKGVKVYPMAAGELVYATDQKALYVANSQDGGDFIRVHGLDMALVSDGEIITSGGEIVWN
jgi:hypothetical protein